MPALPLRLAGPVAGSAPAGIRPFDAYHLRLVDLNRKVRAGTSIPVTFEFDRAGQLTLDAIVQPSQPRRPEPTTRCQAEPTRASPAPAS
ncbi:MAG TPA: hypothetical protein VNV66_02635 [Pilimelia sp.]|nr:hypothetical protein [Pilimelia sp.]